MPSHDVHILISWTSEYVILNGKKNVPHGIKLLILRWGVTLGYMNGSNVIKRIQIKGRQKVKFRDGDTMTETQFGEIHLKDGSIGHELSNAGTT